MERRHQVFVSSTYKDLEDERQEIIYALLELDCMPAGMELFPATDADAWALIKSVIDDSDYYILVIGGRYGSTAADGVSFTEKEYDYAVANGKPVMAFLHGDLFKISAGKSEDTADGKAKLAAFRAKVEGNNHVRYWTSAAELGGIVSRSLVKMKRHYPSDGWIPGSYAMTEATLLELEQMRSRVKELEAELLVAKSTENHSTANADLSQGDDVTNFMAVWVLNDPREEKELNPSITWNRFLKYVGPSLIGECDEETLLERIKLTFWHSTPKEFESRAAYSRLVMPHVTVDAIKLQLRALGYMTPGIKRRAVSDRKTYWALTPIGEEVLFKLTAKKRPIAAQANPSDVGTELPAH